MKHWTEALNALIEKLVFPQIIHRILLWSPEPGTGKSSYAHHRFGSERVERVTLHGRMVPDDLLFQVDLEADNGGTKTVRRAGPALRAMLEGKILVLDEIDQHDPAMRCLLHALLDDKSICGVTLPDGQRITPKEGFAVIGTSNKTPEQFPVALLDRFDVVLNCSSPHPEVFNALPTGVKAALTNRYARVDVQPWRAELSVRRAISFAKLSKTVGDEEAAKMVFGANWQDMLSSFTLAQASEIKV